MVRLIGERSLGEYIHVYEGRMWCKFSSNRQYGPFQFCGGDVVDPINLINIDFPAPKAHTLHGSLSRQALIALEY
jgi:hypothetical protein